MNKIKMKKQKLNENHQISQNCENVKIEMRSFGTLYEPPGSQKKCSEELRSRSIDWRGQMVHKTKIKIV